LLQRHYEELRTSYVNFHMLYSSYSHPAVLFMVLHLIIKSSC